MVAVWTTITDLCFALQATLFLFGTPVSAAVDPIVIEGSHFFYKTNGSEFFIRGVAYQHNFNSSTSSGSTSFVDPLADEASCTRDIPYLQQLKTNVIRVYAIDAASDHSACMDLLDAAGIYVVVDLTTPSIAIDQEHPTWTLELYTAYTSVIDSLQGYTNVLGFFAGNEVSSNSSTTASAAYVKAAVRDMKSYIKTNNYRSIGVGYASNDDASILSSLEDYFNCGDPTSSVDFLGLNIYSWCGSSSFAESGYSALTSSLSNYSIPVFFSEYGCNAIQPRLFAEVSALYSSQMTDVFSGGIVYEYFQETNDYGLVSVSGNSVSTLPDYSNLSTQMASATPFGTASSEYTPTNTVARSCPTTGTVWQASETLPPTPDLVLCSCMISSLTCVAASGVNSTDAATLFSTICGEDSSACSGIASNSTTGEYGAYSVCNITQQVSWAMNQYYLAQNRDSASCDYNGLANVVLSANPNSTCQTLLALAGNAGTGTVSASPTGTGTNTATRTSSGRPSSATSGSSSSGSGSGPFGSGGGGLSTGAKAGIAMGAVLIVVILAGFTLLLRRRKRKTKSNGPPLSGEGGLEVGDPPPQFTALRRAEMEANEVKKYHVVSGEPTDAAIATHDIHVDGELDANRERQELDSTGAPLQPRSSELDRMARQSELAGVVSRGELSGNSTSRSELSPRRKPVSASSPPPVPTQQHQTTSASSSNQPWSDPGSQGLAATGPVTNQTAAEAAEAEEMRRLEDEERRIDEAIAESERLQALRKEKEELQKRKLEIKARASGGGGSSTAPS